MVQEHKSDYSNISPKKFKKIVYVFILCFGLTVTVLKYKYKVLIVSNKCKVLIAKKNMKMYVNLY